MPLMLRATVPCGVDNTDEITQVTHNGDALRLTAALEDLGRAATKGI